MTTIDINSQYHDRVGRFVNKAQSAPEVGLHATTAETVTGDSRWYLREVPPHRRERSLPIPSPLRSGDEGRWSLEEQAGRHLIQRHRPLIAPEASELLYRVVEDESPAAAHVILTYNTEPMLNHEVTGYQPDDSRSLLIAVESGIHNLVVLSGRVVIRVDTSAEVDIETRGDSFVSVIVGSGRKAVVRAHDFSTVYIAAEAGAHGVLRIEDKTAFGTVVGSKAFKRADVWRWHL